MTSPCRHLQRNRKALLKTYARIGTTVIFPSHSRDLARRAREARCHECDSRLDSLLCCCAECAHFACLQHLRIHLRSQSHQFGISLETGHVFCLLCNDFVYDRKYEKMRRDAQNASRRARGISMHHTWNPGKQEIRELAAVKHSVVAVHADSTRGLRGLVNLGSTCFMNCILQALIHTPLLRDYFMTDQHRCHSSDASECLMCETGRLFQACALPRGIILQDFYSGQSSAHVPYRMLHLVWTHARHLAGYEQQDAHEFFIATLDILHRHSRSSSMQRNPHECQCIIHRIFTGSMQSDVTCINCGGISTTVDPYWDISLDLVPHVLPLTLFPDNIADTSISTSEPCMSLADCLDRYIKAEHLGSSAKIKCNRCDSYQESTKQLTLRKMPIVSCFHLKRFEHSTKLRKKMTTPVTFPQFLDMTPYTASFRDRCGETTEQLEMSDSMRALHCNQNRYALFAVVNHFGTMESGHYTCFIRHQADQWFKCDDHVISRASIDQVLNSEGYLLFYHKQFLDYD